MTLGRLDGQTYTEQDNKHQRTGDWDWLSPLTSTQISHIAGTSARGQYDLAPNFEKRQS
jgi:nitric oxide synthase oxygenase domain/subunit